MEEQASRGAQGTAQGLVSVKMFNQTKKANTQNMAQQYKITKRGGS